MGSVFAGIRFCFEMRRRFGVAMRKINGSTDIASNENASKEIASKENASNENTSK